MYAAWVSTRTPKKRISTRQGKSSVSNLNISSSPVEPINLANLVELIENKTISGKIAKDVFEKMWSTSDEVDVIIENEGLQQVTDLTEIELMVTKVIEENPEQLKQYLSGKDRLFGFFVGQVMKESKGKANPSQVNEVLQKKLKK